MKYTIFFAFLALYSAYLIPESSIFGMILLAWSFLNFSIFSLAYGLNKPAYILGKNRDGEISTPLLIINLPWLSVTWFVFQIQALLSKENKIDNICGTNWCISGFPGLSYDSGFELIIDLTAEFPKANHSNVNYVCFSNLDGVALNSFVGQLGLNKDSKVLIHCAQGHGRSAAWCSLCMYEAVFFASALEAYQHILKSRPAARVSKSQYAQLGAFNG